MGSFDNNFFDYVLGRSGDVIGNLLSQTGGMHGLGGGNDPFSTNPYFTALADRIVSNKYQQQRNEAQYQQKPGQQGNKPQQGQPTPPGPSGFGHDSAPGSASAGGVGQQIRALAQQRYGPEGAKVVGALLAAEGGLTGAVGDTDRSLIGSHGPFQFYGPNGQLDNYARALGVDLPTAGQQARSDPLGAATWALDNYLGQALQSGIDQGLTGEALLRRALSAQNPGALSSPADYSRYSHALEVQNALQASLDSRAATTQPGGSPWRVAFGFDQPYSTPLPGGTTRHRGVDLVIPGAPNNGRGTTYTAFVPGTVVALTHDSAGGNGIIVQSDDGLYQRYFHNDQVLVQQGQRVDRNTPIGVVGASGTEGFPHLHFEVARRINGDPIGQTIDPTPWINGQGAGQ